MDSNKKYKRIGETRTMNCGMKATIINYKNVTDIDIQFEDGTIVKNKTYNNFKEGRIKNPNLRKDHSKHIGETKLMNCGMKATIINYKNATDIDIQFEDDTIVKNKTYNSFKKGSIKNPNFKKHVGETNVMNCAMEATIIEYRKNDDIDVQFEDGTIVKNKTYQSFKNGNTYNYNLENTKITKARNKYLNETRTMNCGMKATVIEYFNSGNISVRFEDGIIVKNRTYYNFKKGLIANPNLKNKNNKKENGE